MIFDKEKYVKAWDFACSSHKDQLINGTELPYVNHIGKVVMEALATMGGGHHPHES